MIRTSLPHPPPKETRQDAIVIFVTVCTKNRSQILAATSIHSVLIEVWREAAEWLVGKYLVMPDHIHLMCSPKRRGDSLGKWVHYWKSLSARKFPAELPRPIWQRDYWDTQMRSSKNCAEKWKYISENPVRKGLVSKPHEWEYTGELHRFRFDTF